MSFLDRFKARYKSGQLIFKDGDIGAEMYIVQSGRIELVKEVGGREDVIATLEKGDFFGEMAVLENLPRNMTARVVDDEAEVIAINGTTFDKMIKSNIEIAVRMLRKFSTRLREADEENMRLRELSRALEPGGGGVAAIATPAPVPKRATGPTPSVAEVKVPAPAVAAPAVAAPAVAAPAVVAPAVVAPAVAVPAVAVPAVAVPAVAAPAVAVPAVAVPAVAKPVPARAAGVRPAANLVVKGGARTMRVDSDEFTIGRANPVTGLRPDVDLTAEDLNRFISRRHAKILFKDGTFYLVEEVGVTNGTYVNGKRLQSGVYTPIQFGDELCFGKVFLMFEQPS